MKRTFIFLSLFLMVSASGGWAEEVPVIMLDEGANEIAISVVNSLNRDITGLAIEAEGHEMPAWLTVGSTLRHIEVGQGEKGHEQLVLTMTVDNAPEKAEAPVPFTLTDTDGNSWAFDVHVSVRSGTPAHDALFENYPNPFNPSTTIRFSLGKSSHAELAVFNSLGQKIRTLAEGPQTAGMHMVQWNGCNDSGQRVSSGVYFYRLRSGTYVKTMKMVLFE